jgi:uncharacterized protein YggE
MENFFDKKTASRMGKTLLFLAILTVFYVGMKFVNETKHFNSSDSDISSITTIDVTGTGNSFAIPNVANVSFTIEQKAATIREAQTVVSKKATDVIAFLKSSGIEAKDIQTTNYSANPEYSYPGPCAAGVKCTLADTTPKLLGYTVNETVTVKVRDTEKVGMIVDGLGTRGVTGITGPDFTVDSPDAVNAEARAAAIKNAGEKAQVLAKQLGVTLVRVVRFSENSGGNYPMPMYAKAMDVSVVSGPEAQRLEVGQNKYTSTVTVTYEIP